MSPCYYFSCSPVKITSMCFNRSSVPAGTEWESGPELCLWISTLHSAWEQAVQLLTGGNHLAAETGHTCEHLQFRTRKIQIQWNSWFFLFKGHLNNSSWKWPFFFVFFFPILLIRRKKMQMHLFQTTDGKPLIQNTNAPNYGNKIVNRFLFKQRTYSFNFLYKGVCVCENENINLRFSGQWKAYKGD